VSFIILLLIVTISEAQLKIINPNENFSFSFGPKKYSSRYIVEKVSSETNAEVISKGCKIEIELEENLVVSCPKNVGQTLKNSRRERIFSPMLIDTKSIVKPKDLFDAEALHAPEVWKMGFTGKNRIVALLDTGIDYNHESLKSSFIGGYDFVNDDDDPFDDIGHGTAMAGIITSDGNPEFTMCFNQRRRVSCSAAHDFEFTIPENFSKGIAPDAKIMMGKVCGIFGCFEGDIFLGLEWAVKGLDGVKNSGDEPDVISLSLGTSETWISKNCDDDPLAKEVNKISRNVPVVVSSGNFPFGVSSPACARNAIAAGATGGGFPDFHDLVTSFSGRGYSMQHHGVVAPGVDVFTTIPNDDYEFVSGTSPSAPYVAGLIALMKEKNPSLSASQVKSIVFRSSQHLSEFAFISENPNFEEGHGRIDALAAIRLIR